MEGLTDESSQSGRVFIVLIFIRFSMLSVSNMYREGGVIPQVSPRTIKKKMVNVAESGHPPRFTAVEFGMVRHQPVLGAGGQHGAFNVGISFLAGAQPQPGMERAGAENGDIGPVAGDQRQGAAAMNSRCFTIPLAAKQDQLDIGTVAEQLSDIRSVITRGPLSAGLPPPALTRREASARSARGDLLLGAAWSG